MGYRIIYRGFEVECETVADLVALTEYSSGDGPATRSPRKNKAAKNAPTGDPGRDFINYLQPTHIKTLQVLMAANGPMIDKDLRTSLGVEKNNTLGGYFGAITRAAKKAKFLKGSEIVSKTVLNAKVGEKEYAYEIPQGTVKDHLRQYLPK